ncbi:cytidylate kinase family protein [Patescibacteria group bacterium]|nr:cytidylate kinase family protein [Patescibacteria group bacterium]
MSRKDLIIFLSEQILQIKQEKPVLVVIDGVDASGKTTLAEELAEYLLKIQDREIIRASIDGFHNSEKRRYLKGPDSPEGYYNDSFNYPALVKNLLDPLKSGGAGYKTAIFDYRTNTEVDAPALNATSGAILIMEGVFMLRPEIVKYWDLKIFVDVDFTVTVPRAVKRSAEKNHIGSEEEIRRKYDQRYIPGQKLYLDEAKPKEVADIVIDNTDFEDPKVTKGLST